MAPSPSIAAPTRDTLARLLAAKDQAQAALSALRATHTGNLTIEQRVVLDLRREEAFSVSLKADVAYHDAIKAFIAAQQQVAA